jgi:hypothetical protein
MSCGYLLTRYSRFSEFVAVVFESKQPEALTGHVPDALGTTLFLPLYWMVLVTTAETKSILISFNFSPSASSASTGKC